MKTLLLIILVNICTLTIVNARDIAPFTISQTISANLVLIKITAEDDIKNFAITNIRGVDKITVNKFNEISNLNLKKGETVETQVEISNLVGLAYLNLDIQYFNRNKSRKNFLLVPVGTVTTAQKNERKKHIKTMRFKNHKKGQKNASAKEPDTITENIHLIKID